MSLSRSLSERQTLNFIGDYRRCTALWDPAQTDYTNKLKRRSVYNALGHKYNMTVKGVKSKIKNLRSYYLKEQQKTLVSAVGSEVVEGKGGYLSPWFAYDAMSFIGHLGSGRSASAKDSLPHSDYTVYDDAAEDGEGEGEGEEVVDDFTEQEIMDEPVISCGRLDMLVQVDTETEESESVAVQANRSLKRKLDEGVVKEEQGVGLLSRSQLEKDECSLFGEMVACQIRKLGARNRAVARNKIQNVIFELEMQEFDSASSVQELPDISTKAVTNTHIK